MKPEQFPGATVRRSLGGASHRQTGGLLMVEFTQQQSDFMVCCYCCCGVGGYFMGVRFTWSCLDVFPDRCRGQFVHTAQPAVHVFGLREPLSLSRWSRSGLQRPREPRCPSKIHDSVWWAAGSEESRRSTGRSGLEVVLILTIQDLKVPYYTLFQICVYHLGLQERSSTSLIIQKHPTDLQKTSVYSLLLTCWVLATWII